MFCCAVLIIVLGLCRVAWLFLRGSGRGSEPGFAPPARRPAAAPRSPGPPVGWGPTAGAGAGGSQMSVNLAVGPSGGPTTASRDQHDARSRRLSKADAGGGRR